MISNKTVIGEKIELVIRAVDRTGEIKTSPERGPVADSTQPTAPDPQPTRPQRQEPEPVVETPSRARTSPGAPGGAGLRRGLTQQKEKANG